MKNVYKITCMARPDNSPAWVIFTGTRTNKTQALKLYDEYRVKRTVQGISVKNMSTGEILRAEITGNRITGRRTHRIILK